MPEQIESEGEKIITLDYKYHKLVDNIIYDLYDEFKYGESIGLINKVIFKNVKNTIFQKKKININPIKVFLIRINNLSIN